MTEVIGKGPVNPLPFKFTQEAVDQTASKYLDKLKEIGAPIHDIQDLELQLRGGPCPYCGKEWKERVVHGNVTSHERRWDKEEKAWVEEEETLPDFLGCFTYFVPNCYCIKKLQGKKADLKDNLPYIEGLLEAANIPRGEWKSSFKNWDYNVKQGLSDSMKACSEWVRAGSWKEGAGLMLCGSVGTGKTRCAVMIARDILEREPEFHLHFLPMSDLLTAIIRDQTEAGYIESLRSNRVLIVDDMDKVPVEKEWARGQGFSFYDSCIREGISLIGTTNLTGSDEMAAKFDYSIVSRIMGQCQFIAFKGSREDDYRILRRRYER